MVKANEIRIGNWIEFDNRFFEIHTISEVFPTLNTAEFGIGVVDWNNIKPIELTEEILFKCGFKEDDLFYHKDDIIISNFYEDFLTLDGYDCSKIRYLHQLQNLYFALTNQELNIEL